MPPAPAGIPSTTSTARDTGSPTWLRESDAGSVALERRLLFSYLIVFAAIFVIAGIVVRFVFIESLNHQSAERLDVLARAGLRSTVIRGDRLAVDKAEVTNSMLLAKDQGLEWFDRSGRLVGSQGLTATSADRQSFDTVTIPIVNPQTREVVGSVRASEWNEERRKDSHWLDTGLATGALLAIVGSGFGGLALARRAVRPVAQTFRTLREFTADASHELRGPLTAIAGNADAALRDDSRDPARDRARFEAIADGARQMSRLTSDLLLIAGADRSLEDDLFIIDVPTLLERVTQRFTERFADAGVEFHVAFTPAISYGSPDQVERIVSNLIENALRYTPRGGSVWVTNERDRNLELIIVRDTGIGIAAEHHERIFDRFWRADPTRAQEGTGLGLSIARALAQRHGGDVTLTSRPGAGSRFVVSFPIRPPRVD